MGQLTDNLSFITSQFRWQDVIDIALVWFIVYRILLLIRATGTLQMLSGMGVLALAFLASLRLELFTLNWILESFFSNLFLIVVILFQGDIRRALAHIGSNPLYFNSTIRQERAIVEELARAAQELAQAGLGALIVIEREIDLEYFLELGTDIDAEVSSDLLRAIFESSSPLHDGAVIIRDGRVAMAGSFLPLSKNTEIDRHFGSRHRAALGLTEQTDAVVMVVSEERKTVGIVSQGEMKQNLDPQTLRRELFAAFDLKAKREQLEGVSS